MAASQYHLTKSSSPCKRAAAMDRPLAGRIISQSFDKSPERNSQEPGGPLITGGFGFGLEFAVLGFEPPESVEAGVLGDEYKDGEGDPCSFAAEETVDDFLSPEGPADDETEAISV